MHNQSCQFFEVYKGSYLSKNSLTESQVGVPAGMMRVTGVAAVIGVMNRNNRIYTKENYLRHIELLQDDIAEGLYGELEHPDGFTINNNNISHKIEAVWFNDATNEVMITLLLLDTEKGKIAQSIINSGGKLRVSSRAMGSVGANNEAVITKLVTFDIVGTPGFAQSSLLLSENLKKIGSDELCESFILLNKNNKDMSNQNVQKLRQAQQKLAQCGEDEQMVQTQTPQLDKKTADLIENWLLNDVFPCYESYRERVAINESLGKPSCSFAAYVQMQRGLRESVAMNEAKRKVYDSGKSDIRGWDKFITIGTFNVPDHKVKNDVQKAFNRAGASDVEYKLEVSGEDDRYWDLYYHNKDEKTVLSAVKLIESMQTNESEDNYLSLYQNRGQQKLQQDEEELRESLSRVYQRLLESEDENEQQKLSQKADQIRQQLADLDEDVKQTFQSNQLAKCQQKIQQGQQLSDEDIDGLTQEELQQLIDHQETLEEGQQRPQQVQQQLTQGQQLAQQLQQDEILTQNQQRVLQKLQQGQQLTQNQQEVLKQMQETGMITQKQLQMLQNCQQLPESDEEVNESLVGRRTRKNLQSGSSLLESISTRVRRAVGSKN